MVLALPVQAQEAPDPPDPDVCRDRAESRQLDFWIGTWEVVHPEDGRVLGPGGGLPQTHGRQVIPALVPPPAGRHLPPMPERRRVPTAAPWAETVGYSRAVRVGDTIYVSGTAPIGEDGEIAHRGDVYEQAKLCLDIIMAALGEAGARPEHVVRTRLYVRDASSWADVGRAHAQVLGHAKPATTLVEVSGFIHPEILVEIEAVAVV